MTIILKDDNDNVLPQEVQDKVNNFIDNLSKINWFKPSINLKRKDIEKQAELTLKCFGIETEIECINILNREDWNGAWSSAIVLNGKLTIDSTLDLIEEIAQNSNMKSVHNLVCKSTGDSIMNSNWDSLIRCIPPYNGIRYLAHVSTQAVKEILFENNTAFSSKYPQGAFKQLFKLWEMGLYPIGILESTKKFTIYIPPSLVEFPEDFK